MPVFQLSFETVSVDERVHGQVLRVVTATDLGHYEAVGQVSSGVAHHHRQIHALKPFNHVSRNLQHVLQLLVYLN